MAGLESVRFLIVDDNVHMLNIVKTLLRGFGVTQVMEAKTVHEAFMRLRQDTVDIIILDYLMGDQDGVEFLKRLRDEGDSPSPYVPVIMLTAHSERRRVETARDAGATEFCAKPITAADLHAKIAMVINRPRPFIRSKTYFGPDRRRRDGDNYEGEERRKGMGGSNDAGGDRGG